MFKQALFVCMAVAMIALSGMPATATTGSDSTGKRRVCGVCWQSIV